MKKFFLFIIFFTGVVLATAQKKERFKFLSNETMQFYNQAKECWNTTEESCIPFYQKMLASAKKNKECVPCAEIELVIGLYNESQVDSSIFHAQNVLKEAKNEKGRLKLELEQDAYQLLAGNFVLKGDNQKGIRYLLESGKRVEKLGNKIQIATLQGNLGAIYNNIGNHEKGIQFQKNAFSALKSAGDTKRISVFASNISGAYIDSNNPDSARVWGKKTINLAITNKDIASEAAGYYLTGASFEKTNRDSAMYYVDKSIPLAIAANNLNYLATSYNIKGNIYAEKTQYEEAKRYFLKSIEIYKSLGKPPGLYAPLKSLGIAANQFKDYETASTNMNEYITYQDSVVSEENRKVVHELNAKYEAEKKEKLLASQKLRIEKEQNQKRLIVIVGTLLILMILFLFLFYRRNQKIKAQKAVKEKENEVLTAFINGEERERNRISCELHDGVASMIGVAKMNMEALPHLSAEKQVEQIIKVVQILENTHADIRHIAHNLLPITLEQEGLIKATEQFASELNDTGILKIIVTNDFQGDLILSIQKQLMLFRMIQELINNSIKHSQAQIATINFHQSNNSLLIEISDDGVGFIGEITKESQGLYSIKQRMSSILGQFVFEKGLNNKGVKASLKLNVL
jgi:tetratricopeptide (TPR) repeat protein/two-component sensor histidine kinase